MMIKIKIRVIWFVKNMCRRRYAMNWVTHKPSFEFEKFSPIIRSQSAWSGHLDFAYDLVRFENQKL